MTDIMLNGKRFKASPEALAAMQKDGVKFEMAPADSGEGGIMETTGDALRGAAHGASFGLADMKFGEDNESVMQRLGMDDYADVQGRSPIASGVGDVAGSIVSPLSKIGAAAKGASAATRIGRAALGSGIEGATREMAGGASAGDTASAGGWSAMLGALVPGAGVGIGKALNTQTAQKGVQAVSGLAGKAADAARLRAFGLGASEMNKLGQKMGPQNLGQRVAADLEQLAPSPKYGSNAEAKGLQLQALADQAGQDIGASLQEAGVNEGLDKFVPGAWAQIQQRLGDKAGKLPFDSPQANNIRNASSGFAERIMDPNNPAPKDLAGLHKRISDWGKEAFKGDTITSRGDTAAAEAAEFGRSIGREELDNVMQYALDPTRQAFDDAMGRYSDVIDYAKAATKRGNTEAANSNLIGGAVAAGAPVLGGLTAGIPGFLGGLYTAASSGTRNYLTQLLSGSRGYDVGANAARGAQQYLSNVAPGKMQALGQQLATQPAATGALPRTLAARAGGEVADTLSDEEQYRY